MKPHISWWSQFTTLWQETEFIKSSLMVKLVVFQNITSRFLYTMRILSVHHMHHDLLKCLNCHEVIVAITRVRAHCFPDHTYLNPISVCCGWLIYIYIYIYKYLYIIHEAFPNIFTPPCTPFLQYNWVLGKDYVTYGF